MHTNWTFDHPKATLEHLGFIPEFLSEDDPRSAAEQINENYHHGGGWRPMAGWELDHTNRAITYGKDHIDPPYQPIAHTKFREELIVFYRHSWLAIVQPDGKYEVSRID